MIHICKAMVLICTLLKKMGFRELVTTLDPRYVMPGHKHLPEVELPCVCRDATAKQKTSFVVSSILKQPQTCDQAAPHKPYLSLTAHFIKYFLENHTGKMITQNLRQALESWRLQ